MNQANPVCHIPAQRIHYTSRPRSGSCTVRMGWSVPNSDGTPLGAGIAYWHGDDGPFKTLDYDEVLYIVEGRFGFELEDGSRLEGGPGDTLSIGRGTAVRYFGANAKVFFAVTRAS